MEPEYESLEEFAQYLDDDERETFTHTDLLKLAQYTGKSNAAIRAELETYGYTLMTRPKPQSFRGFSKCSF